MEFRFRGFAEIQGAVFQFQLCLSDNEVPLWSRAEREPSHLLACLEYPLSLLCCLKKLSQHLYRHGAVGCLLFLAF